MSSSLGMIRLVVLARMRRWEGASLFLEEMAVRIWPGRAVTAKQWGNGGGGGGSRKLLPLVGLTVH